MNHWEQVARDIWSVLRWPLPVAFLFFSGLVLEREKNNFSNTELGSYLLVGGLFLYAAAMLGWWV